MPGIQPFMTSISNGILNKEPPRAEPHAWWWERSENESRKKTISFSSYFDYDFIDYYIGHSVHLCCR